MSYPKKISRETILESAMAYLENHGLAELSMRTLATNLGVTPNALYRYFASKADLEYAMADEAGRLLLSTLQKAADGQQAPAAIISMAKAYVQFARHYPELYAVKMHHCAHDGSEPDSHTDVWGFVITLAASLNSPWDAKDLATSLWAFLHGMVELDRANLLDGQAPDTAIQVGLEVMLAGLMTRMTHSH
jgi:AcrR family transcriptional regulator